MAKAFECDLCKKLVKTAKDADDFYPRRIKVHITYARATSKENLDLCWDCRLELLKTVIKMIEAKSKYTWNDLKDPKKAAELLGGQQ